MHLCDRKWTLLFIIIVVPAGFYTKLYSGPLSDWVNNSLGGILYVIFWSLLFSLFVPKTSPLKITFIVFCTTCFIEFLQLWHPPFLEVIRSNFIGRTILGSTFSWLDIFHYILGFIFSLMLLSYLNKIEKRTT